jgi:hypothetical protein
MNMATRLKDQIRKANTRAKTNRRFESRLRAEGEAKAYQTVLFWVECQQRKPAAHQDHPIAAVLRDGETFRELARKVEFCEITWPQCREVGEPIRIYTT